MQQDLTLLIEQTMAEVDTHANNKDWTMYIVSELNLNRLLQERNYAELLATKDNQEAIKKGLNKNAKLYKQMIKEIELLRELMQLLSQKKTFWDDFKSVFKG